MCRRADGRYIARHEAEEEKRIKEEAEHRAKLQAQWEAERKTKETAMRLKAEAQRARAITQRNQERDAKRKFRLQRNHERAQRREMRERLTAAVTALEAMKGRLEDTQAELRDVVRHCAVGCSCEWHSTLTAISCAHAVTQNKALRAASRMEHAALKARAQWQQRANNTVAWAHAGIEKVIATTEHMTDTGAGAGAGAGAGEGGLAGRHSATAQAAFHGLGAATPDDP